MLCSLGWPQTLNPPASARALVLQVCSTTPSNRVFLIPNTDYGQVTELGPWLQSVRLVPEHSLHRTRAMIPCPIPQSQGQNSLISKSYTFKSMVIVFKKN